MLNTEMHQAEKVSNGDKPNMPSEALDPNRKRTEGHVIHCDTKTVIVAADVDPNVDYMENYWAVGQLISIKVGDNRVIGQTASVVTPDPEWVEGGRNRVHIHIELIGEIFPDGDKSYFTTGISGFPQIGCIAHRIRTNDLAAIYEHKADSTITIGHLTQDKTIEAKIDFEKLLSRHFAVVGSTGVGKSTSVSLMLRKIVEARPDIRVLMLDPHNEFSSAFPHNSIVVNARNLALPFWLFGLDEIAEVIFRGQAGLEAEKELLRDFITNARQIQLQEGEEASSLVKRQSKKTRVNADTPIPYRIADLLKLIDDRLGLLDNKSEKPTLKSLKDRIETISNDARFQFMFDQATCGGDKIGDVISKIFRVPQNGKPICVLEMSGLPSEVVSSVVSVVCRMAFDLAISSEGGIQTLVVCEEAHRYIPANADDGFWPTRAAIGRIAKEGRKYGVYLGIITQRPGELDTTILSQCNSFFAMRLSNRKDQEIIAGAFNSGAQSTIAFLPSISNRECIAFGEALYTPMRMTFEKVEAKDLPGANIRENQDAVRAGKRINLNSVISKMRGSTHRTHVEEVDELADLAPPKQKAAALEPSGSALRGQDSRSGLQGFKVQAHEAPPLAPANYQREAGSTPSRPANGTVHNAGAASGGMTGARTGEATATSSTPAPNVPREYVPPTSKQASAAAEQLNPNANKSVEERYKEAQEAALRVKKENAGNALFKAFRGQ